MRALLSLLACLLGGLASAHAMHGKKKVKLQGRRNNHRHQVAPTCSRHAEFHQNDGNGLVFIAIVTTPSAVERREEIRATWRKHPAFRTGVVSAAFFVGHPANQSELDILESESGKHSDIECLDVQEGYDRLTPKTAAILQWFGRTREDKFFMKLDDDTWPNLDLLIPRLESEERDMALLGHIFSCAPVLHDTKWKEDPNVFNSEFYPPYAQGSGYVMTSKLVQHILAKGAQGDMPLLHNEDAAVGLWVWNAKEKDEISAQIVHVDSTVYGCKESDIMTMNLWKGDMTCMWRKKNMGMKNICCADKDSNGAPVFPHDRSVASEKVSILRKVLDAFGASGGADKTVSSDEDAEEAEAEEEGTDETSFLQVASTSSARAGRKEGCFKKESPIWETLLIGVPPEN